VSGPLNIARHPFRNDRLPTLALALGCLLLLAASVRQAFAVRDLLPGRAGKVDAELVALDADVARLRARAAELRHETTSPGTLDEWAAVRGLVDRRAFSWSALLACLEDTLPAGVRLRSIAPGREGGRLRVKLEAVGRTEADGYAFLAALQKRPEFAKAFLNSLSETPDGIALSYTVQYAPGVEGPEARR
jgi:Tfp pilus assembly protein PilN